MIKITLNNLTTEQMKMFKTVCDTFPFHIGDYSNVEIDCSKISERVVKDVMSNVYAARMTVDTKNMSFIELATKLNEHRK